MRLEGAAALRRLLHHLEAMPGIVLQLADHPVMEIAGLTVMRGLATPWMMKDTMGVLSPKGGGREII